ncbi:MAG TPA: glycine zipper 2TM domain-containing protein [Rhizobiaceae bacterium]
MRLHVAFVSALVCVALSGCATSEQDRRAGTGALIGTGVGALAGQAIGGNTGSTIVGAGAGALLGAVVGTASTPRSTGYCRYQRPDGTIYTDRC